jgi:mycofactocin glycosyltransferase
VPGHPPLPPPSLGFPAGFGVSWDLKTQAYDGGRVVVGGVPRRVLRLAAHAREALDDLAGPRTRSLDEALAGGLVRPLLDAGLMHPVPSPDGPVPADVTVVVPVRDRAGDLGRLLPQLGRVGRVVVVDDGSGDASAEVAVAHGAEVVRRSRPGGPAAARNTGLGVVVSPLVAFIDSDVRLPDGWLEALLPHFGDGTVAAVAPRVRGEVVGRTDRLARYEVTRSPLDLGPHPGYVRPGNRVPFVPAAVLVVRTAAARDLGGFDESLEVGEDVDFVWRLAAAGWRVRYEPAVSVFHPARLDLRSFLARRVDYGTSAALLHRRHPGSVAPLRVSPWSAAVWGAALAGWPRLAWGLGGWTVGRLSRALHGKVDEALPVAWDVAGVGHLGMARLLASALARTWLPAALVAMGIARQTRRPLLLLLALGPAADWLERRPPLGPPAYGLLHLADDAAYCVGVWQGCWRQRTLGPLQPTRFVPEPLFGRTSGAGRLRGAGRSGI